MREIMEIPPQTPKKRGKTWSFLIPHALMDTKVLKKEKYYIVKVYESSKETHDNLRNI